MEPKRKNNLAIIKISSINIGKLNIIHQGVTLNSSREINIYISAINKTLICFAFSAVEINRPQYLITSPAFYRVDEEEKVTVLIIGSKPCQVQVRLKPEGSRTTAARASGTFEPGERGTLKLRVKYNTNTPIQKLI